MQQNQQSMNHLETSAKSPTHRKSASTRLVSIATRRCTTFLAVTLLVVAFSACSELPEPGYYFLSRPRAILLHDDFWWSSEDCPECNGWTTGATESASFDSFVGASFFAALTPHQLLLSQNRIEGSVVIDFEFEVWPSDSVAFDRSGEAYDYRVVLADDSSDSTGLAGPSIELALFFDTDGDSAGDSDVVRIREDAELSSDASEDIRATGLFLERGSVSIVADPFREPPTIEASLFGLDGVRVLTTSREFSNGWSEPFRIGLQASGSILSGSLQIRTVDSITVTAGAAR